MKWDIVSSQTILTCVPFTVEQIQFKDEAGSELPPYHRLRAPDWVIVLPVTADGRAVLVRQVRAGIGAATLEVPGGCLDPSEKDSMMAAARELEEETGFTSQRILPLAVLSPNPAIMSNRAHYFLALGCHPHPNRRHFPDANEVLETELADLHELDSMIRLGKINHSLSALCIMLAKKYIRTDR